MARFVAATIVGFFLAVATPAGPGGVGWGAWAVVLWLTGGVATGEIYLYALQELDEDFDPYHYKMLVVLFWPLFLYRCVF